MQLLIYQYFLIVCTIASIAIFFQRPILSYLRLFPIFLIVTFFVELTSNWLAIHRGSNVELSNIYLIFNFSFYLFFFKKIVNNRSVKKTIIVIAMFFIFLSVMNILYWQKIDQWNSISYSFGSLLVIVLSSYYFFELFRNPKAKKLSKEPAFWICSGLLFFYTSSFPFLGLNNFLRNMPQVMVEQLGFILMLLNIMLYLLFTIAFLCRLNFRKKAKGSPTWLWWLPH